MNFKNFFGYATIFEMAASRQVRSAQKSSWSSIPLILAIGFFLSGSLLESKSQEKGKGGKKMAFELTSSAFSQNGMIPSQYTCDGKDISPALKWNDPPQGTKSFALINDDPDAPMGTWVHWVIFNIPIGDRELKEDMPPDAELKNGARQGITDFGRIGYGGPCPPTGTHRYFFKLYALDTLLNLPSGCTKAQLLNAMKGHLLSEAQLIGKYKRQRS